jgi:hypothetical protein
VLVAVNKASASGPIATPMKIPYCRSVPEQLLGFKTFSDAERSAHFLVEAPCEQVTHHMNHTVPVLLKAGMGAFRDYLTTLGDRATARSPAHARGHRPARVLTLSRPPGLRRRRSVVYPGSQASGRCFCTSGLGLTPCCYVDEAAQGKPNYSPKRHHARLEAHSFSIGCIRNKHMLIGC